MRKSSSEILFFDHGEYADYLEWAAKEQGFWGEEFLRTSKEMLESFFPDPRKIVLKRDLLSVSESGKVAILWRPSVQAPFNFHFNLKSGKGKVYIENSDFSITIPKEWYSLWQEWLDLYGEESLEKGGFSPKGEKPFFVLYELLRNPARNMAFYFWEDYSLFLEDLGRFLEEACPKFQPFFMDWVDFLTAFFTQAFHLDGSNAMPLYRLAPERRPTTLRIWGFPVARSLLVEYYGGSGTMDISMAAFEVKVHFDY